MGVVAGVFGGVLIMACVYKWYKKKWWLSSSFYLSITLFNIIFVFTK